ncbi:hypothetical protein D8674_004653 [Pyrus ussuriensis x Pyrus communis]|uniref:CASP-like protein n=1 Tax=Pyrus ussuriensis x Pyrus communis TaxID=2448454 RepID=A0A5N5FKH5_9ROSA|nr:hypothetical protein D8674_004653 [Pyrus ussuriensis x Pyrus communis]
MDREQDELQFLGIFGIYKEAYKIVFSRRKIFSQITLALILPLSIVFLAHIALSNIILSKIIHNEIVLDGTSTNNPRYEKISDVISSEWATYWLFNAAYFTFVLIFSLLSTSAVVYTIACIYTAREITFKKVMSVVPKVWKPVMVTFLCTFMAFFCYNIVALIVLIIWVLSMGISGASVIIGFLLLIVYFIGFGYLTLIWQLASVVSVLEEARGIKAMAKSKELLKGNMWVATIIYFKLNVLAALLQFGFQQLVVSGRFFAIATGILRAYLLLFLPFSIVTIIRPHAAAPKPVLLILTTWRLLRNTTGSAAATAIVHLAHNGNSDANWLAICQQFGDFCWKTSGAVVLAFVAVVLSL